MQRLIDRVAALAARQPDGAAVVEVRDATVREWSWSRLWQESTRAAALLLQLGVARGEAVAYQVPNRAEFVALTLGALRIGAICCPLMPIFRERELRFMLERARARVFFTVDRYRARRCAEEAAGFAAQIPTLQSVVVIGDAADQPLPAARGRLRWEHYEQALSSATAQAPALASLAPPPEALAQLLFTSGTTGVPKGVLHRQDVLLRAAQMEIEHLGLGDTDRIFVPSPLAHQTGFLYGMWLALTLGVAQIVQENWEPRRALQAINEHAATFVQAATPFLMDLENAVEAGADPPRALRIFVATGAAVPRATARRACRTLHTSVCGAFGTTEGCLATLASPADPPEKAWGSDGRTLASVRIRVRDAAGRVLPAGQEGHYEIHSPTMFEGYLDAPELTAETFTEDGWYRTGDLAVIDAEGYLHITGRVKDVINRGGEKVPVAEIEQLLYQHEAVAEVAIVAMPDPRLGERACAFVVPRAGCSLDLTAMQAFLDAQRVAKQYWPERLELLEALPKTPSGKIQKYALREQARGLAQAS